MYFWPFSPETEMTELFDTRTTRVYWQRKTTAIERLCTHSLQKRGKNTISEMFSSELKIVADCLLKWFNAKIKSNHLELNGGVKLKYEIEHPIDWQRQRCCICTLPLEINSTQFDADKETMSYTYFIILKEHKFLKNISSDQERATSNSIKILKNFHAAFCKFPKISILLPTVLNTAVGELFWKRWQLFWRWTPIHFLPQKMLRLWEFWRVVRGYCLRWSEIQRQN